jgi:hypothetical protein
MSVQQIRLMVPRPVAVPRGALWAAQWVASVGRLLGRRQTRPAPSSYQRRTPTLLDVAGQSMGRALSGAGRLVWCALEGAGQRRAAHELRGMAERWQSIDPAMAQQMHDAVRHLDDIRR